MTLEGSLKGSMVLLGLTVRRRHSKAAFEVSNSTVPVISHFIKQPYRNLCLEKVL